MPNSWAMAKPSGGSSGLGSSDKLLAGFSYDLAEFLPKPASLNSSCYQSASSCAMLFNC